MNDFYITIKSQHGKIHFLNNTASNFKVKLNRPLLLKEGWKVALVQYKSPISEDVYVCSDVCMSSIVGEKQYSILRLIPSDQVSIPYPYYIPVSQNFIDCIQIYHLSAKTEESLQLNTRGVTYVTLHFLYKP